MYPYIARENFYLFFAICNLFFFSLLRTVFKWLRLFTMNIHPFFSLHFRFLFSTNGTVCVWNYLKDRRILYLFFIHCQCLNFYWQPQFFLWGKNVKFKFLALNLFNIKIVYIYLPLVSCLSYLPLPMPRIPMLLTVFNVHSITFCCCSFFPLPFVIQKILDVFFHIFFMSYPLGLHIFQLFFSFLPYFFFNSFHRLMYVVSHSK